MAHSSTATITVDRISNSGNTIAAQQRSGKTIHVPAGEVGETYDVRLVDRGGYFEARLVDRTAETTPRQPTISRPDTSQVGQDLLDRSRSGHSYAIRTTVPGERKRDTEGQQLRHRLSRRKK